MKRILAFVGFVVLQAGPASAQKFGTAEDEAAIRIIVNHWQQAWENFDPSILAGDYADDADWLNAFGVRNKGSANILAFAATVFKRPTVQGRQTTWDAPQVRFVRSDVAIASRDYKTIGHKIPNGTEMPERHTHSTWILTKENGKWRIASQVISDDNHPVPQ